MYPRGQLDALALRKEVLRARIMVRRLECSLHAHTACGPLRTIDRLWAKWRTISPVVKAVGIPLLMLVVKRLLRRRGVARQTGKGKFATVMAALPIILQVMRAIREQRRRTHEYESASA